MIASRRAASRATRAIHESTRGLKVAVLGSTGGIGQPLALLCKLSPLIDEVACYDVVGTPGVAADLSHCPTPAKLTATCRLRVPGRRARTPASRPHSLAPISSSSQRAYRASR